MNATVVPMKIEGRSGCAAPRPHRRSGARGHRARPGVGLRPRRRPERRQPKEYAPAARPPRAPGSSAGAFSEPVAAVHRAPSAGRGRTLCRPGRRLLRQRHGGVHHRWTKTGLIVRRGPRRGLEAVEFATLEWVHWYNDRRLLGPIEYIPPAQKETHYFRQLLESAIAA